MKILIQSSLFVFLLYFAAFDTVYLAGFYFDATYKVVHDLFFQLSSFFLGLKLALNKRKSIRIFMGGILFLLVPFYTLTFFNSPHNILQKVELGDDFIYITSYGANATTIPNIYVTKVERCFLSFSCSERLYTVADYSSYEFSLLEDTSCFLFSATDLSKSEYSFRHCNK